MIHMWFTGINYYKLAVEKDRDSIFTTITTIWKPGFSVSRIMCVKTFMKLVFRIKYTKIKQISSTGNGPRSNAKSQRLLFDGDETKYELWEARSLGCLIANHKIEENNTIIGTLRKKATKRRMKRVTPS